MDAVPSGAGRSSLRTARPHPVGWADAATFTMADLTMLRKELLLGYCVAGMLAVNVSNSIWHDLFWTGHGFWTTLQNVAIGPFIGIVSFVCSVGNVPLAAALWRGGISFGGVISFLFADLITFPILLIYRRYYGTRMMLRMLALFWICMSVAGAITEGLFQVVGAAPTKRPVVIAAGHFAWNYTTYLNFIFLALFGLLYWLYRTRNADNANNELARDPVCGMQVVASEAPASASLPAHHGFSAPSTARTGSRNTLTALPAVSQLIFPWTYPVNESRMRQQSDNMMSFRHTGQCM